MKKGLLLLSSLFILLGASPVLAQTTTRIEELRTEIQELESTLKQKKTELHELRASEEGFYTIETNSATYVFSNPRIEGDRLLLDLDYTNDTKGALDVYNDLWMLTFAQEDETSIHQLWVNNDGLPEVADRQPLSYNVRIKSGATVKLLIGLSRTAEVYYGEPYMEGEQLVEEEEASSEETPIEPKVFDDLSPLFIRVDPYSSPTGQSEEIEIPLN